MSNKFNIKKYGIIQIKIKRLQLKGIRDLKLANKTFLGTFLVKEKRILSKFKRKNKEKI